MKTVSVIIPAYNAEKYLREAIDSVLNQSLAPTEVIVINDGSRDNTAEVLNAISGIKVIHQDNLGIGRTLNKGLELASCELIAFLDADDLWLPEKLATQMAELERMHYHGIVFSLVEQFISEDVAADVRARLENPTQYMTGVHRSTMLIDRQSMDKTGPFSTDFISAEFLEWYMRAKEVNVPVRIIDQVFVKRRIHGNNITLGLERKESTQFPLVIKQALDRRRSGK